MALPKFEIIFRKRFEKVFVKVDKQTQQQIVDELGELAKSPFKHSQVKKISGTQNGYRIRFGRWRILFAIDDKKIDVVDLFMEKNKHDYEIRMKLFK